MHPTAYGIAILPTPDRNTPSGHLRRRNNRRFTHRASGNHRSTFLTWRAPPGQGPHTRVCGAPPGGGGLLSAGGTPPWLAGRAFPGGAGGTHDDRAEDPRPHPGIRAASGEQMGVVIALRGVLLSNNVYDTDIDIDYSKV